jgi:REP element-mobilizing transposase RayT
LHHVIARGIEKRQIVDDEEDRARFIDRLAEIVGASRTRVYAWVIMPNHFIPLSYLPVFVYLDGGLNLQDIFTF